MIKNSSFFRIGYVFLALSFVIAGACSVSLSSEKHWGAITVKEASVRVGPSATSPLVFKLHEGAPFMVEGQQQGWLRIVLSDGQKGWVLEKEVAAFTYSRA